MWRLLTDRELRALKLAEEKCKLEPTYPMWVRCNRCYRERFDARTEKSMLEHLQSMYVSDVPLLIRSLHDVLTFLYNQGTISRNPSSAKTSTITLSK